MKFSERIPVSHRQSPHTDAYIKVLDGTQEYKEQLIFKASRFYDAILLTDKTSLRKLINSFGWYPVPEDFPKKILDNIIRTIGSIAYLRSSKLGLEHWLRTLTCGNVSFDDSEFYPKPSYIIPSDYEAGYLFTEADYPVDTLYLFDGTDVFAPRFLIVYISTPYWKLESLRKYIEDNITKYIPFVDEGTTITINLSPGDFEKNQIAYQYFEGDESAVISLSLETEAGDAITSYPVDVINQNGDTLGAAANAPAYITLWNADPDNTVGYIISGTGTTFNVLINPLYTGEPKLLAS